MENKIICFIDAFSTYQKVQYPDGQIDRVAFNDLATLLPQTCHAENIFQIHLYGNSNFCEGLLYEIQNNEMTLYGFNKIEIEVN